MKLNVFAYGLLATALLTGCDSLKQEVNPKGISQQPEKLVVACFISPQDTILAARVTRSLPVLGTNSPYNTDVNNATVSLSDGARSVSLRPTRGQGNSPYSYPFYTLYRADVRELPIIAGKTYTLTVRVPDGRQVTATCTVPAPVAVQEILLDSTVTNNFGRSRNEYFARLRWRDPIGQVNFYRVAGDNEYSYTSQIRTSANGPVRDTLIQTRSNWSFENRSLATDLGRDGQEFISGRGRIGIGYIRINDQLVGRPTGQLNAYLLQVDENYYRYHDSVQRQNQVDNNPFAEPVPITTNIQGGLGCFGAYNRSTLSLTIN